MCGIVGVTGKTNTVEILINGLEKLEYRGYDSAGIFVDNQTGEDYLVKEAGRISNLKSAIDDNIHGTAGIGHTRWATHGVPSKFNAHPHVSEDGRFYLVHNGVITNFSELKAQYLKDVNFVSETDTEVVVQLIGYFANEENLTAKQAFKKVLSLLEGSSYAFLMMDREEPETLFVAKNKSPLLIGVGDGFNVVCSDAMAMLKETHDFIELMDGEMVVVKPGSIEIENKNGEAVSRDSYHVEMDDSDSEKGAYPFYMLKEIDEQPAVMRRLLSEYVENEEMVKIDAHILNAMKAADRLYIVAAGTSYHAGLVGKELFESLANVPTEVHVASEFGYHMPLLSEKPFFIFLSQSGETADSRQVLVKVNEMMYPSLTITNSANSTLSREATYTLLLHAGPEIAVASTKAYTAQIAVEALLAKALGTVTGQTKAIDYDVYHELTAVANAMQAMVDEKESINDLAKEFLSETRNAFYIGRGIDYDVSIEAALKLKEVSYVQTEGFASGELKHGTIALIEEGTPVVAIITDAPTASHTRGNVQEVLARGANTITISTESLADRKSTRLNSSHPH